MSCHLRYRRAERRRRLGTLLIGVAALALFAADLAAGSSGMTLDRLFAAMAAGPDALEPDAIILWSVRLPMSATAFMVGAALGLAGLLIQTITANALASPSTLGITSGASFGAALAIAFGWSLMGELWMGTIAAAFAFALLISAGILSLGRFRGMTPGTLILAGIIMNFFFTALQQFLQYRSSPETAQLIAGWTFGNLERSSLLAAGAAAGALVLTLVFMLPNAWKLTALTVGEERAKSLGIAVGRLRLAAFAAAALLVAASVSFIGTVAFVGLVAPHAAKLILGDDARDLIPASTLLGGALLLASALTAKLLSTGAMLPVGIVTSLVGVPFLFWLLLRDRGGLNA